MVDKLAIGFIKIGLKKGDRLGIWSPNRLEWVLTQFATARIGVILVNINPAYRLSELEYSLKKVGCKALILAKKFKSSEYLKMILSLAPELETSKKGKLQAKNLPYLNHVILMDKWMNYSGIWMFEDIFNLGGDKEKQKLIEIDKKLSLMMQSIFNLLRNNWTTKRSYFISLQHCE